MVPRNNHIRSYSLRPPVTVVSQISHWVTQQSLSSPPPWYDYGEHVTQQTVTKHGAQNMVLEHGIEKYGDERGL